MNSRNGFVLVSTMMMLSLLLALLAVYFVTTSAETATVRYTRGAASGFYAAEAGLNLRADTIRQIFVGYNRPSGTSPNPTNACTTGNMGTGNFACSNYTFNNRAVSTYVSEDPSNPVILTIPVGERYQNLNAQEYRYTAKSQATFNSDNLEANLELRFKSRLVPLFQFAAFYNKDLEILPGPNMTLSGPVHTNGSLWLYCNSATLTIQGQVTTAGDVWRGRKDGSVTPSCNNQPVNIFDPLVARTLIPSCPLRTMATPAQIQPFNNMIQTRVQPVTVPGPEVFDPTPGKVYWDKADLRLVLNVDNATPPNVISTQVRNADDTVNAAATATLLACPGNISGKAVGSTTIQNFRENKRIRLLDVDLRNTLECLRTSNWFGTGKLLNENSEGGLVFHLTVRGNSSASAANPYGVRIQNAAQIRATTGGAPVPLGFTVVSDQAAYIKGDFNSVNKVPAAVMADSLNLLSNNWNDANSAAGIGSRVASNTIYNSAFLAGTDTTGGVEGAGGVGGYYNGGLENYPRLHEDWSGRTMTYRGSFVSLGVAQHVAGRWTAQSYSPPSRDWNYDVSFNNAANLPPITPRFVYLKQELFVRDFDLGS